MNFIEQFQERGYFILRGAIPPKALLAARRAMERLVDQHAGKMVADGLNDHRFENEPFETRMYKIYEKHLDHAPKFFRRELHVPEMFDVFFDPSVLDQVEELIGSEIRLYPNYTVRPKFPDWEGTLVLWHQDGGYTVARGTSGLQKEETLDKGGTVDNLRMVNAWAPLVPATIENGCMQFVPGTHRLGFVPHVNKKHYLEIAEDVLKPHLKNAVNIELAPGDLVLFHNLLFHQGQANRTQHIRWSVDWRYQDATQGTMRTDPGCIARSRITPSSAIQTPDQWVNVESLSLA